MGTMARPRSALRALAVAALIAALPASPATTAMAAREPFDDFIARARASWTAFEAALGSVVAREDYRQEARWPETPEGEAAVRDMRSEVVLIQIPGSDEWVTFRQVEEVDGAPPPEPAPSVTATLNDASRPLHDRIGLLVRAGSAYNLGDFERTINKPTFAPIVLRPEHARGVRFRREGTATLDGRRAAVVRFDETARPTIVRGRMERNVPMRGRLWLELESGQVLRSSLVMREARGKLTATIDVNYGHDAGLGMMVPQVMRERYERQGHVVTAEARYSNYRRFTTSVRIIGG
jgi:hypothetical protein